VKNLSIYVDKNTIIHKVSPISKLYYILASIIIPIINPDFKLIVITTIMSVTILLIGKVFKYTLKLLAFNIILIISIILIQGMFNPNNKEIFFRIWIFNFYKEGLLVAFKIILRLLNIISSFSILIFTTKPSELIESLVYRGFSPRIGYIMIRVNKTSFKELVRYANEGKYAHIKTDYSVDSKEVANVIGYIPGSDSNLKDEYLLITAHLDHNGDNKDGTYNPGALDNASGVSVMMEIARVIQENNIKPKKSVVFIAFNGEEQGLLGSQYYVRKPVLPLDKAEVINLDMVGSKEDVPLYISSYSDMKTELRNKLYVYSKDLELGIDIKLSNSASSDSTSFQEKDVDAITLIDHDWKSGYHSPKDTIDLIDSSRIEKISKLILYYIDKTCY